MTATHIDGIAVIADEAVSSPLKKADGSPVLFTRIRALLLDNGTTTYGCAVCDYTHVTVGAIRVHLGTHNEPTEPKTPRKVVPDEIMELTIGQVVGMYRQIDSLTADRDKWKTRAVKAEKAMDTLRKALGQ